MNNLGGQSLVMTLEEWWLHGRMMSHSITQVELWVCAITTLMEASLNPNVYDDFG